MALLLFSLALLLEPQHQVAQAQNATRTPATPTTTPDNLEKAPSSTDANTIQSDAAEALLDAQVNALIAKMSPSERVGQLFMITFEGNDTSFESDIAELIYAYHVGGLVLSPQNGNFSNAKEQDTPQQVATLVNRLQALAYGYLVPPTGTLQSLTTTGELPPGFVSLAEKTSVPALSIPLFIAVEQMGDDLPHTALRRNFTALPTQMALGATWDPELTRRVGQIVGRELRAVGVNLLLGPTLDVVEQPRTDAIGALGVHTFGGDPTWVSQMSSAYIAGVHEGSGGDVATIVRHFPGQGDVDRLPDQEVATIQREQTELARVSLAPFTSVTRKLSTILRADGDAGATDGMMTGHTRYSALQANNPGRNLPLSLDQELDTLLHQAPFADWRAGGGLIMSSALGVPALRPYFEAAQDHPYRRIALEAFTAGHDLLYLDEPNADQDWAIEKQHMIEAIVFFQGRYAQEPDFAARVDNSLRRILRLKLRLYDSSEPVTDAIFGSIATPPATGIETATLTITNTGVGSASVTPVLTVTLPLTSARAPTSSLLSAQPLPLTATVAQTATLSITQAQTITLPTTLESPLIPLTSVWVQAPELVVFQSENRAEADKVMEQVARESVTLLYPDPQAGGDVLMAPEANDHLLIVTDSRPLRECAQCTTDPALGADKLAEIMLALYGPNATGQLRADQVVSITFDELAELLNATQADETGLGETPPIQANPVQANALLTPTLAAGVATTQTEEAETELPADRANKIAETERLIEESNWLIFAMLDVKPEEYPSSTVVKQFLSQRSEQLGGKRVVVFGLNAPYFLDATEVSKLTAYYGIFSKTQKSLESAVRALFRSHLPIGAPPVDVPGTRFAALAERLKPDPTRRLELQILLGEQIVSLDGTSGTNSLALYAGDIIRISVGPILDLNGHLVRDGTQVQFQLQYQGENLPLTMEPVGTRNGSAVRDVPLDRPGLLQIVAGSEAASTGEAVELTVQANLSGNPVRPAPRSPLPTNTNTVTSTMPITTGTGSGQGSAPAPVDERRVNLVTLVIALLTIVITLSLLLIVQIWILPRHMLVRSMLWATIFGLAAYILYGIGLIPGANALRDALHSLGPVVVVFIAMLLPLLWLQLSTEQPE